MTASPKSARAALVGLELIFTLTLIFHVLVLTRIIPFDIVWGGRLQSAEEMYVFETVSIVLNAFFLAMTIFRKDKNKRQGKEAFLKWTFYAMAVLFSLNTVGNILANNNWERFFFAPLTGLMAFLCVIAAKERIN